MYWRSPSSVMQAENCGESAITVTPQIAETANSRNGFAPKRNPTNKQHVPLIAMAQQVTAVRPTRSASSPPPPHPTAPPPIIRNDDHSASSDVVCPANAIGVFRAARLARIITGIQAHIAYSSHMWPK